KSAAPGQETTFLESKLQETSGAILSLKERNIKRTLLILGLGFLAAVVLLAQWLNAPPPGYVPLDAGAAGAAAAAKPAMDLGPADLLRSPLFYLLWIMFACGAGAGLMIIANITTIAKLGNIEAGFILVALLAVGNAGGRIVAGMASDILGRLWTMFLIFVFQACLMLVLRAGLSNMAAFVVVSMLLGFNYGACLSVFPSAAKDYFGLKNFGVNYGLVFTAWGVGGLVFPLAAGRMFEAARAATGSGSYNAAYLMAASLLVVAAALTFPARKLETAHHAGRSA
ncbi:MAG: MFS transporter, partial [Elusimicrobiota bacterium]